MELARREAEAAGVPPERVVLGGFSQGGAVALRASQKGSYGPTRSCFRIVRVCSEDFGTFGVVELLDEC